MMQAKLGAVHEIVDEGGGHWLADIDLEWEDGRVERCPYGVDMIDQAPVCVALREMIQGGQIQVNPPIATVIQATTDAIAARAAQRDAALAKLEKLGLTADDMKAALS